MGHTHSTVRMKKLSVVFEATYCVWGFAGIWMWVGALKGTVVVRIFMRRITGPCNTWSWLNTNIYIASRMLFVYWLIMLNTIKKDPGIVIENTNFLLCQRYKSITSSKWGCFQRFMRSFLSSFWRETLVMRRANFKKNRRCIQSPRWRIQTPTNCIWQDV